MNKKADWLFNISKGKPLYIAGPCSAETEEQVLTIAHALKNTKTTVFRAGVWKPRTRPGNFEGVGKIALPWLKRVKKETGLLISIEVANANQVKLALENEVDILWIGARTSVNPFAVQEIANALEGTEKMVFVKNPINPDLGLWIGAVERLQKANIKNIGMIHRGFSSYRKSNYRNEPNWQIAIDIKNHFPNLPLICDPSHIGGKRDLIADLSQTALDLQYNGLMIETHHNPDKAWSDAMQQITPEKLKTILSSLVVRKSKFEEVSAKEILKNLRIEINQLDKQLIAILAERMQISKKIGQEKKKQNVAVLQPKRWSEIFERNINEGLKNGLSEDFIEKIYKSIHQESIIHQKSVLKNKDH